jgi:hypothetical protein
MALSSTPCLSSSQISSDSSAWGDLALVLIYTAVRDKTWEPIFSFWFNDYSDWLVPFCVLTLDSAVSARLVSDH